MLLHVLFRPGGVLLTVSPILICSAAIPGTGILLLLAVALMSLGRGTVETVLWVFLGFALFMLGVMGYAFALAARSQTIRCWCDGSRLHVVRRRGPLEALADEVTVAVQKRTVGMQGKVTLHEVTLNAPSWPESVAVHSGLTRWAADRAAVRVRGHIASARSRSLT